MASQLYCFNTVSQKSNDHLTILWGWFSCWVVIFLAKVLYCNCNYIYLLRSLKNSYQDQKYGYIPSLISKRANLKTGVLRKQSTPNFDTLGVRNVRFSENLACFVFLKHPFLDSSPFRLITDDTWLCIHDGVTTEEKVDCDLKKNKALKATDLSSENNKLK